ncbi:unnamed protein product [Cuscuta campestris]|uniref:Protein kinase domain-containing protein n=1 Tax=Cuscuta campestris TaxID=132261 RepID=A0A484MXG4_9ASTE|nr:unnamed protein product [Cuscuta campestris]
MPLPPLAAVILVFFHVTAIAYDCSPPPSSSSRLPSCPPFISAPPYPFSAFPGCGHPSFQIRCSSPLALISINNISFSLLRYGSSSLLISPVSPPSPPPRHSNCSIPQRFVNLSGSPFRVSDSSCSRLSVLRPCPPPVLLDCRSCRWECGLFENPSRLVGGCGSTRRRNHLQGCTGGIFELLDRYLEMGIEVEWDENHRNDSYFSGCRACRSSNGVCGFNSSHPMKPFLCFRPPTSAGHPQIRERTPRRISMLSLGFLFVCCMIAFATGALIFRSRKRGGSDSKDEPTAVYLRRHRAATLLPPEFTYEELESSTGHFGPTRKIGDGGFGSVYLGHLRDGRVVAVKHLHRHLNEGLSKKSFCNEILILSSINHPNLVKIHGYCSDPRGLLLVYDYVPNGTLSDHLHGTKGSCRRGPRLSWSVRVDIAMQVAVAIEYLHFSVVPPVVHRDITSSNVFVEKDMRVKVGDFGLSRLLIQSSSGDVWTGPQGTPGYLDPDYYRSFRLNEKSDIYSFGVVLLELITGLRAVDEKREKREMTLVDMVVPRIQTGALHQVVDPALFVDGEVVDGVGAVAELAFRCVASDKDDRPDAREVALELRRIKSRARGSGVLRVSNSSNAIVPEGVGPSLEHVGTAPPEASLGS